MVKFMKMLFKMKRKSAMTLLSLLVVLLVSSALIVMFIPVLTQGLINITTGKSGRGGVNLSRSSGYFLCYYNESGVLTQTRADIPANGQATITTSSAISNECRFVIPTNADEFRFTLIGGGGGGASASVGLDETVVENTQFTFKPNDIQNINFADTNYKKSILNKFFINSSICVASCNFSPVDFQLGSGGTLTLGYDNTNFNFTRNTTSQLSYVGGTCASATCTDCTRYIRRSTQNCGGSSYLNINGHTVPRNDEVVLSARQPVLTVNSSNGGRSGAVVNQTVSFLEPVQGQNYFAIRAADLGTGGAGVAANRACAAANRGGNTVLRLGGGAAPIIAAGGECGGTTPQDRLLNAMEVVRGQNGEAESRFIPAAMNIINLSRGRGSADVSQAPVAATYPGAGGGGGAINVNAGGIEENRMVATHGGTDVDIDFPRPTVGDLRVQSSAGGAGARGAILIAW